MDLGRGAGRRMSCVAVRACVFWEIGILAIPSRREMISAAAAASANRSNKGCAGRYMSDDENLIPWFDTPLSETMSD